MAVLLRFSNRPLVHAICRAARRSCSSTTSSAHEASVDWLAAKLRAKESVTVLDASYYLSSATRRAAYDEYIKAHIPRARFFDIDAISDTSSQLPHMLPSADVFARAAAVLGIQHDVPVVVYDCSMFKGVSLPGQSGGLYSAARVWWTLRYFGHRNVRVLDGGLAAWADAGYALQSGAPHDSSVPAEVWQPVHSLVASMSDVRELSTMLTSGSHAAAAAIVDARSMERFVGTAPEPRAGLSSGHMPGARCVPFGSVMQPSGHMRSVAEVEALFAAAGVPAAANDARVVATCGSGVTACVLAHAVARVRAQRGAAEDGLDHISVYDGAWAEWASKAHGNPIAQGPA